MPFQNIKSIKEELEADNPTTQAKTENHSFIDYLVRKTNQAMTCFKQVSELMVNTYVDLCLQKRGGPGAPAPPSGSDEKSKLLVHQESHTAPNDSDILSLNQRQPPTEGEPLCCFGCCRPRLDISFTEAMDQRDSSVMDPPDTGLSYEGPWQRTSKDSHLSNGQSLG